MHGKERSDKSTAVSNQSFHRHSKRISQQSTSNSDSEDPVHLCRISLKRERETGRNSHVNPQLVRQSIFNASWRRVDCSTGHEKRCKSLVYRSVSVRANPIPRNLFQVKLFNVRCSMQERRKQSISLQSGTVNPPLSNSIQKRSIERYSG